MMAAMLGIGTLSGLCSAGVLALINVALQQPQHRGTLVMTVFVLAVAFKLILQIVSQRLLTRFAQDTTFELSLSLCQKILQSPLRLSERQGPGRILATLSDDVSMLAWSIQCLPSLAMNMAVVLGCSVYLIWVSWSLFLVVMGATLVGALGYQWLHRRAFSVIYASREARGRLFQQFRSLTDGLKELLMHRDRREEFVGQEVRGAAEAYRQSSINASNQYALAEAFSHLSFYALVGVILFGFHGLLDLSPNALIGYVVVLLYMMSPIWGVIGTLPTVERGQVAFDAIQRLGLSLNEERSPTGDPMISADREMAHISFENVCFSYEATDPGADTFALGPITFEIRSGELVFIIGGNGSGKSTLVKLLVGLYEPQNGTIRCNSAIVTRQNREWYRNHFSVVFSDFFVFEKLLGLHDTPTSGLVQDYLRRLQLDQKVSIRDRTFSTVDLSQGQRKRLALITAYLEDRPLYVFDEWAADQDPQYKEVFYRQILHDLKARGKSVIVITHDDRYFHLGDQVIKLEDGRIVEVQRRSAGLKPIEA